MDLAIQHRLDAILFNSHGAFEQTDDEYLKRFQERAAAHGITIYMGVGSITNENARFVKQFGSPEALLAEGMAEHCPGVALHIETVAGGVTRIPYLESEFWNGCREVRAEELVGFSRLLIRGHQVDIQQASSDADRGAFRREFPKTEFLSSLAVLCTKYGAGVKRPIWPDPAMSVDDRTQTAHQRPGKVRLDCCSRKLNSPLSPFGTIPQ